MRLFILKHLLLLLLLNVFAVPSKDSAVQLEGTIVSEVDVKIFTSAGKILETHHHREDQYRKVEILNDFDFPISLFFEAYGDTGTYLVELRSNDSIQLLAVIGYEFYATRVNSFERLLTKRIMDGVSTYVFGPENPPKQTWVIVLVANDLYFYAAIATAEQVRNSGKWNQDIVILCEEVVFKNKNNRNLAARVHSTLRVLPKRDFAQIFNTWQNQRNQNPMKKFYQYMKFYAMDVWFKQWDFVFYMDAGMHVFHPLERMLTIITQSDRFYAHSDAYPTFEWTLHSQFEWTINKTQSQTLLDRYKHFDMDYFQSGVMIFSTNLIENNSVDRLFELMNEFSATHRNDQFIFNLYVQFERGGLWMPLPVRDSLGFLYDSTDRHGFQKEDYVMMKHPGWLKRK